MHKIMIAGSGTDVGKTIVAAIITKLLDGDYWKPIQCGIEDSTDTATMKNFLDVTQHHIHSPSYSLNAPLSPHHAARLEKIKIDPDLIIPPQTNRCLVIEGVGGVFVPLTINTLTIDLFTKWNCLWIIVSKHYIGSINHTLLTIEALKLRRIPIVGIIFNGEPNTDSESAILEFSQVPYIGRLLPEKILNQEIITGYANLWRPTVSQLLP